jgi:hypothetical protein
VTNRNLPGLLFSDSYDSLSVARIQCEGLLNVNVASCFQTLNAECEVTERGRGNVNDIGATRSQQLRDFTKGMLDLEAIA